MLNDIRDAIRLLRLNPAFSLTAILTLALGIGATTAVYSVFDAVLLKPLPFDHPGRVVAVRIRQEDGGSFGISAGTLAMVRTLPAIERTALFIRAELAAASVLLVAVGITAAYVPARRASRVDPIVALRTE